MTTQDYGRRRDLRPGLSSPPPSGLWHFRFSTDGQVNSQRVSEEV